MKNNLTPVFAGLIEKRKFLGISITIPLSLLFHTLVLAGLIVHPLLNITKNMPKPKNVLVKLLSMPGTSVPGIRISSTGGKRDHKRPNEGKHRNTFRNIAPLIIPNEIPDPEILPDSQKSDLETAGGIDPNLFDGLDIGSDFIGNGKDPGNIAVSIIKSPVLLRKVKPTYPPLAIKARVSGKVILEAITDIYGKVIVVRIVTGNPLLNNAAKTAVGQWLYEPYIINGIPKPVKFTVTVNFSLTRR